METMVEQWAKLLRELRYERSVSQRHLAEHAKVNVSVVSRAERGQDARLSTWEKLFGGLGYTLEFKAQEIAEEIGDILEYETEQRLRRREEGLLHRHFR